MWLEITQNSNLYPWFHFNIAKYIMIVFTNHTIHSVLIMNLLPWIDGPILETSLPATHFLICHCSMYTNISQCRKPTSWPLLLSDPYNSHQMHVKVLDLSCFLSLPLDQLWHGRAGIRAALCVSPKMTVQCISCSAEFRYMRPNGSVNGRYHSPLWEITTFYQWVEFTVKWEKNIMTRMPNIGKDRDTEGPNNLVLRNPRETEYTTNNNNNHVTSYFKMLKMPKVSEHLK